MHDYLKVKALSLGAEARIIKDMENQRLAKAYVNRLRGKDASYHEKVYRGLNDHRRTIVRNEARWTNIARGFLRGHSYDAIERNSYQCPNWNRVEELVLKYGEDDPKDLAVRFAAWKAEALKGFNGRYEPNTYPGSTRYQPTPWVLRNHQGSGSQWRKWHIETFRPEALATTEPGC
jgi:hypothetical protein